MSTFKTNDFALKELLNEIEKGRIQLPDFQRGWVWDDAHIRDLLVSVAQSFPVGAVMMMQTGGEVKFEQRGFEGVEPRPQPQAAEWLILDGQQRLTTLTQVLQLQNPVKTRNAKGQERRFNYYWHIPTALREDVDLLEAVVTVDENKIRHDPFDSTRHLNLSSLQAECEGLYFPCNATFNADNWEDGLDDFNPSGRQAYKQFRQKILSNFREYKLPAIQLLRGTPREAVCVVFEKVNTGGVPLNVFELITATYAAESFNLRDDWLGSVERKVQGRSKRLYGVELLRNVQASDFIQSITLLETLRRRRERLDALDLAHAWLLPAAELHQLPPVSAKRKTMLDLSLEGYKRWADKVEAGWLQVPQFLRMLSIMRMRELPYQTQLVPLAAILSELVDQAWLAPVHFEKLSRWFWCGVLGEMYGGAVESRVARDVEEVLDWLLRDGPLPATVQDASFDAQRLERLYTRNSAAYKGVSVLVLREGARDWYYKTTVDKLSHDDMLSLDIHHIFPENWCKKQGIDYKVYNSIINKTSISYKANRKIGGVAPSLYLPKLQADKLVALSNEAMDEILQSHQIPPELLRSDDFDAFYQKRKAHLLTLIERAMGKTSQVMLDSDLDSEALEAADMEPEDVELDPAL